MATLRELEGLLAQALECLDESAALVRELTELETKANLVRLGHAITSAWEVRDELHKAYPDLKPPFVIEYEQDRPRYEKLSELTQQAYAAEDSGDFKQAIALYGQLLSSAVSGYFRTVAEAGMYRLSVRNGVVG